MRRAENSAVGLTALYARRSRMVDDALAGPEDGAVKVAEAEWPDHFPNGCPGCEPCHDVSGSVYRLVRNPRDPKDSRSWLQIPLDDGESSDCELAGLSSCVTLDDIRDLKRSSRRFRNRRIARGDLSPEHGKIAKTTSKPGHYTLWLRRVALGQHDELFKVIE